MELKIMKSGVYCILNLINGKHYVGSSQDIESRWRKHQNLLSRKKHHCLKLQRAWNKYGESNFRLDILEITTIDIALEREQFWIDNTLPFYNILRFAETVRGLKHSDKAKLKMSLAKAGRKISDSQKQRQSMALKGRKLTQEHKDKLKGKVVSEETRKKLSIANTGVVRSDEVKRKNRLARLGKKLTTEQKARLKAGKDKMTEAQRENVKRVTALTHSKSYIVTSPEGVEYSVFNLSKFSRENGLGNGCGLSRVATGIRGQYKGWKCIFADLETVKKAA